jgi:Ca2+-binding RTX toxin-like protein
MTPSRAAPADVTLLGAGNDLFIWNPGDGSDIVDGQADLDTLEFNGSNASENIAIAANGQRVSLTSDVGNVVMDVNGVEHTELAPWRCRQNRGQRPDRHGRHAGCANLDHGQSDQVNVSHRRCGCHRDRSGDGEVTGLPRRLRSRTPTATTSSWYGWRWRRVIDASNLPAGQIGLTLNGGAGVDVIAGSQGDDTVVGGQGDDRAFLGDGNDLFVWNPGDGSDIVNGQAGFDTLDFNGANISENINISANGSVALLTRNVAAIEMNLAGVERIQFEARAGADNTVNDLTRTGVKQVDRHSGQAPTTARPTP